MFDKLEDLERRYEEIQAELSEPEVVNDQTRFRKLMKEQTDMGSIVDKYREYKNTKKTIEESLELLDAENDPDMREMIKEELSSARQRVPEIENELKILLLPKDPNDE